MRTHWPIVMVCACLLSGCGDANKPRAPRRRAYPSLDAAPPPPLLPYLSVDNAGAMADRDGETNKMLKKSTPDQELYEKHRLMEQQVASLRAYAAQAAADDPFALSEEAIKAFEERGEPDIL